MWRAADPHSSRTCALAAVLHPRHIVGVCKGTILSRRLTVHDKARQKGRLACVTMVAARGCSSTHRPLLRGLLNAQAMPRNAHVHLRTSRCTVNPPRPGPPCCLGSDSRRSSRLANGCARGMRLVVACSCHKTRQQRNSSALRGPGACYRQRNRPMRFGASCVSGVGPYPPHNPPGTRHLSHFKHGERVREQKPAVVKICQWLQAWCCQTSKQGPGLQLNN